MRSEAVQRDVSFSVDGREFVAPDGMTLTAALLRNDIRAVRTNPVSGRPRGPFCGMGVCFECEVVVDGTVARACLTPVNEGLSVETGLSR